MIEEAARERFERAVDWPLTGAALLFLITWSWSVIDADLGAGWRTVCWVVEWGVWVVFVLDYATRLFLSIDKFGFLRTSLVDLVVVVLPFFRPLRLLRLVKLLAVFNRHAGTSLNTRVASYAVGGTTLVVWVAAVAELDVERGRPGSTIETIGESLWWALTTITTVGYGDRRPTTPAGQWIAAGLMVLGVALVGIVAATFASWLLNRAISEEEAVARPTQDDVAELLREVRSLRQEMRELRRVTSERRR